MITIRHVAILDFASQTTDLISSLYRDTGFPVQTYPHNVSVSVLAAARPAAVILSGGPQSVNKDPLPTDPRLLPYLEENNIPTLGLCYGHQLLGQYLGGEIGRNPEYGEAHMRCVAFDQLFGDWDGEIVWMNHGDVVVGAGDLVPIGYTDKGALAAFRSAPGRGRLYGVQFHPEVTHTPHGKKLLSDFAEMFGGLHPYPTARGDFDAPDFIKTATAELKAAVGTRQPVVYLSGGVDSSTVAALAVRAGLKPKLVYLDMGNGRLGEAKEVKERFEALWDTEVYVHNVSGEFVSALVDIHDDIQTRREFARLYADTLTAVNKKFGLTSGKAILFDGTNATDLRESGKRSAGASAAAEIKAHHNVEAQKGYAASGVTRYMPLRQLTKQRVRAVGKALGLPEEVFSRPPYPGPGMYVRFDDVYQPVPDYLQKEVRAFAEPYDYQVFVLPRKRVGLKGDGRVLQHAALLSGPRKWKAARRLGKRLIEDFPLADALYLPKIDDGGEFSANYFQKTIPFPRNRENIASLQIATDITEKTLARYDVRSAQTPVIAFGGPEGPIFVLRPVDSKDFRTLHPLEMGDESAEFPWAAYDDIRTQIENDPEIRKAGRPLVLVSLADKPGATTEWW